MEMLVIFDKDTPKKHRYMGQAKGISIGVYIEKWVKPIPKEISIRLVTKAEAEALMDELMKTREEMEKEVKVNEAD